MYYIYNYRLSVSCALATLCCFLSDIHTGKTNARGRGGIYAVYAGYRGKRGAGSGGGTITIP